MVPHAHIYKCHLKASNQSLNYWHLTTVAGMLELEAVDDAGCELELEAHAGSQLELEGVDDILERADDMLE